MEWYDRNNGRPHLRGNPLDKPYFENPDWTMDKTIITDETYNPEIHKRRHRRHHRNRHPHKPLADLSHFYVVVPISNPRRYRRRYELYWRFAEMCEDAGINLITVEQAFGNREWMVTEKGNPFHVQVRSFEELWLKENLINIGIAHVKRVDPQAREIAWVDADCFPMSAPHTWFEETWHALQHYEFVQMWQYLINFGPNNEPVTGPQLSFMATYAANGYKVPVGKNVKHTLAGNSGMVSLGRPGLAWAANLSAIEAVGGLIDFCILGSGDWHMAHGLVGAMNQGSYEQTKLSKYSEALFKWQEKCERWIKRDVGFVPMTVGHWWHGNKVDRKYGERGSILVRNGYDPNEDIKYDSQGLLMLETHEPRQIHFRDDIRDYFTTRNEDSIDVY